MWRLVLKKEVKAMESYKEKNLKRLKELIQSGKIESKLEKRYFVDLYKEAVKDIYPKLKEEYAGQTIYGISFEIANLVQKIYSEDFYTIIYLNTEEMYQEAIEDLNEEEDESEEFYRFSAWSEWDVVDEKLADSSYFIKVQNYLKENSLRFCFEYSDIAEEMEDIWDEDIEEWYEEMEDEIYEKEEEDIRMWLAQALGELRNEGFWEEQGNPDIYVLPFEGECEIDQEEMILTFKEMDQGYHGSEYLQYIKNYIDE